MDWITLWGALYLLVSWFAKESCKYSGKTSLEFIFVSGRFLCIGGRFPDTNHKAQLVYPVILSGALEVHDVGLHRELVRVLFGSSRSPWSHCGSPGTRWELWYWYWMLTICLIRCVRADRSSTQLAFVFANEITTFFAILDASPFRKPMLYIHFAIRNYFTSSKNRISRL